MIDRAIRALLPDALLRDPWTLQERVVMLVDAEGIIVAFTSVDQLPIGIQLEAFPGEVWTAAPILAHAHLESFDAPSTTWSRDSFAAWVEDLLAWRVSSDRMSPSESAQHSLHELKQHGCGLVLSHVAEVGADGSALESLPEVIALPEVFAPEVALFQPEQLATALDRAGMALHAPYSVAAEVAAQVFRSFRRQGLVSVHLGEHAEEREYLRSGSGPIGDLLQRRQRPIASSRWASPVAWLKSVGGVQPGTLAVHAGDLQVEELQALQRGGVEVVFCPGTHDYFQRPPVHFVAAGVRLPALGCDSRASNETLDPLREVALAFAMMPEPGPQAWWEALTTHGASALQRDDLGALQVGRRAMVLRLSATEASVENGAGDLCAWLCHGQVGQRKVTNFRRVSPSANESA